MQYLENRYVINSRISGNGQNLMLVYPQALWTNSLKSINVETFTFTIEEKLTDCTLRRVEPSLASNYEAKDGETLSIQDSYLAAAIDNVLVAGLFLVQHAWRKWEQETAAEADSLLISVTYDGLLENRAQLVVRIAELTMAIRFARDENQKLVIVNHAIALRDLGRNEEMMTLIDSVDWSACASRFRLAVAALKNDVDTFFGLLPKAVTADDLTRSEVEAWPLFKQLREREDFWPRAEKAFSKNHVAAEKASEA